MPSHFLDQHPSGDIDYLRRVVAWANAQREDYWHPAPGKHVSWLNIVAVYNAVQFLGSEIEEVIADDLPFPWVSYTKDERRAINTVRSALGLPFKRS